MEIEERIKSEITTYPWDVLEGKIIACNYVKLACQRFINFLHRDDLYFDVDAVLRVAESCYDLNINKLGFSSSNMKD